jgi:ATP-dependent Clp protease ATP-binding subunit ClpC
MRETNSLAGMVLREMGLEAGQVVHAVEQVVGRGETPPANKPELAPPLKQAIELSVDEARLLGHQYIGTEHLMLGLIRQGESTAIDVMRSLDLDLKQVRAELARTILQGQAMAQQKLPELSFETETPKNPLTPLHFDLTQEAEEGKLDPLIGRQQIIDRILQILGRRAKHNPILVGEPGVGKRAIVRGLALRMAEWQVPPDLWQRRLLVVDGNLPTSVVYRTLIQERVAKALDEAARANAIIFIDNIHKLITAAGTNIEFANVIKFALMRDDIQVIGATTPAYFQKYIDGEAAREWHLQAIHVKEASLEETTQILQGMKPRYEAHHQLPIEEDALNAAAHLAARYVTDRVLPGKAIDLLDEAGSYARMHNMPNVTEVRDTYRKLRRVKKAKQEAQEAQHTDDALELRQQEMDLEAKLAELRETLHNAGHETSVTLENVAEVASMWTGIPASQMIDEERARLRGTQ